MTEPSLLLGDNSPSSEGRESLDASDSPFDDNEPQSPDEIVQEVYDTPLAQPPFLWKEGQRVIGSPLYLHDTQTSGNNHEDGFRRLEGKEGGVYMVGRGSCHDSRVEGRVSTR